jgi:hypothetical protein
VLVKLRMNITSSVSIIVAVFILTSVVTLVQVYQVSRRITLAD